MRIQTRRRYAVAFTDCRSGQIDRRATGAWLPGRLRGSNHGPELETERHRKNRSRLAQRAQTIAQGLLIVATRICLIGLAISSSQSSVTVILGPRLILGERRRATADQRRQHYRQGANHQGGRKRFWIWACGAFHRTHCSHLCYWVQKPPAHCLVCLRGTTIDKMPPYAVGQYCSHKLTRRSVPYLSNTNR